LNNNAIVGLSRVVDCQLLEVFVKCSVLVIIGIGRVFPLRLSLGLKEAEVKLFIEICGSGREVDGFVIDRLPALASLSLPDVEAVGSAVVAVSVVPEPVVLGGADHHHHVHRRVLHLSHDDVPGWSPFIIESLR
jgi:hypothetical protein